MKKKLFLLALALSGLNAQTIQSINFKGLIHLSPDVATQIMGLKQIYTSKIILMIST